MKKGKNRYYTGLPCARGHRSIRQTSTGSCIECGKEDRKGKYKKKRQEYIKEYNKRKRAEFAKVRDGMAA